MRISGRIKVTIGILVFLGLVVNGVYDTFAEGEGHAITIDAPPGATAVVSQQLLAFDQRMIAFEVVETEGDDAAGDLVVESPAFSLVASGGILFAHSGGEAAIGAGEAMALQPGVPYTYEAIGSAAQSPHWFRLGISHEEVGAANSIERPLDAVTGKRELELWLITLDGAEKADFSTIDGPVLLLAVSGEIVAERAGEASSTLQSGDFIQFNHDLGIENSAGEPAIVALLAIGPDLEAASADAGSDSRGQVQSPTQGTPPAESPTSGQDDPAPTPTPTPTPAPANTTDNDGDGLTYDEEIAASCHPEEWDSDQDGLADGEEIELYGSKCTAVDSDGDTLDDFHEVMLFGSSPVAYDTDGDTLDDGYEINYGLNPRSIDTDSDLLADNEEPNYGTPPDQPDNDDDGLLDGEEILIYGTNPNKTDHDNDGLNDGLEVLSYRTDPLDPDSDDDGIFDYDEVKGLSDPNDPNSVPTM